MQIQQDQEEPWQWKPVGNGFIEVQIRSWRDFQEYVHENLQQIDSFIWRGQRCEHWSLESTIARLIRQSPIQSAQHYDFVNKHLEKYKLATRGRRGANPTSLLSEDDWWALGQHHGLATPLLDWSSSPFVAAFFAFAEVGSGQTSNRAIYALQEHIVNGIAEGKASAAEISRLKQIREYEAGRLQLGILGRAFIDNEVLPEVRFIRPQSDENQRLVSQAGLFTRVPTGQTLESWVQDNNPDNNESQFTLLKILIPNKDRDNCLRMLNRMNINHLSLFPDLGGASQYCNLFSEIESY